MTKKLTHEEQVTAITKVNPNIEVIGVITGNMEKVSCRCKTCNHEWFGRPADLKRCIGCPKCAASKRAQKRALPHEEQIAIIAKVNPGIKVLGEIINNKTKVLCYCKVCDHEWMARPETLKIGRGCPKCADRRLTHEEQVASITKVNSNIEILGKITASLKKVLCKCKICNYEWSATPNNLKHGTGCPKCSGHTKLSHEEQIAVIAKTSPSVEVLGKIINNTTRTLCRCKSCGHEWLTTPASLKKGTGCPKCAELKSAQARRISHEEQIKAIANINPNIKVVGKITGNKTKVLCLCKVCGYKWRATPQKLKEGSGCLKCAKKGFLSYERGKLYIMVDDLEVPTLMKVGVSVKENERRNRILSSAHKAGVMIPDLHIVKTLEGTTQNIYELEGAIHKTLSNYKINFPVKFDGSCEFFYYRPEVFNMVEDKYKEITKAA